MISRGIKQNVKREYFIYSPLSKYYPCNLTLNEHLKGMQPLITGPHLKKKALKIFFEYFLQAQVILLVAEWIV